LKKTRGEVGVTGGEAKNRDEIGRADKALSWSEIVSRQQKK